MISCKRHKQTKSKGLMALFLAAGFGLLVFPGLSDRACGQVATPASGSRVLGTVTAVSGSGLTLKNGKGVEVKVAVPDSARIQQAQPGASNAATIKLQDISVGDRVLAIGSASDDGASFTASRVVAMKSSDIAQQQQRERQAWQTHGISGLVKSVDPAAATITVSTGSGPSAKTVVVKAATGASIRRYAPDSTQFDEAKAATLDQIKPGDQLRAKGEKNADGTKLAADAIIAGTFRNIAGTVVSVDPAANRLTVTNLETKRPFIINVNGDSQLHKLSPMMAQGIAARLKGGAPAQGAARGGDSGSHAPDGAAGTAPGGGPGAPGQRGGDLQQMLNHAPPLQLADLKKGDAVMVLTTEGQTPGAATAVTLLAGVEPLLQASPGSSQSVLSASWSLGGGAAAAGQDAQ